MTRKDTQTERQPICMIRFLQDYFVEEYVEHPTRGDNMLDLFATNDHELVPRMVIEDTKLGYYRFFFVINTTIDKSNKKFHNQDKLY